MLQQGDKCQGEFNVLGHMKQSAVILELLCEVGLKETQVEMCLLGKIG